MRPPASVSAFLVTSLPTLDAPASVRNGNPLCGAPFRSATAALIVRAAFRYASSSVKGPGFMMDLRCPPMPAIPFGGGDWQ